MEFEPSTHWRPINAIAGPPMPRSAGGSTCTCLPRERLTGPGGRPGWRLGFSGLFVGLLALYASFSGCLQTNDLSADALTSFEEPSPGAGKAAGEHQAMPAGAAANAAISNSVPGDTAANPEAERTVVPHEDKPPGFGSNLPSPDEASKTGDGATSPAPTGTGTGTAGTVVPVVGTPEPHTHKEMPPGFGSNLPPEGQAHPLDEHPHKEMPPGFGSTQAPEGSAAPPTVAAGAGSGVGEPRKVAAGLPTEFETKYKGKKMVTISGIIRYSGEVPQNIDLDCFQPDPKTPGGRHLVNKVKLVEAGPYSFKVPANYGPLIVTGFVDLSANGPDSKDPQGSYSKNPLEVKDRDVKGIDLELKVANRSP